MRRTVCSTANNLANFMRTLALPRALKRWSLTNLREILVKIGAQIVRASVSGVHNLVEGIECELRRRFPDIAPVIGNAEPRCTV
jgi:hypothetical protein